jgi:hypothetical protein
MDDCSGLFVFTRDGHLSVQVMERNPPAQTHAESQQYSQGGYEASWGTYIVDERARTFTFRVEGALVRALVGKDLPRMRIFEGLALLRLATKFTYELKLDGCPGWARLNTQPEHMKQFVAQATQR